MLKKQFYITSILCLLGSIAFAQGFKSPYPLYKTNPYKMDFEGYTLPISEELVKSKKVKSVTVFLAKTDSNEEKMVQTISFDEKGRIVSYNPNIGSKTQDYIFRVWYENGLISGFTQALYKSPTDWEEVQVTYNYKDGKYESQDQVTTTTKPDSTGEKKAHLGVFTDEKGNVKKITISQVINKQLTRGYAAQFEYVINGNDSIVETYILIPGREKQKITEHYYTQYEDCKYQYKVYKPYKGHELEEMLDQGDYSKCEADKRPPAGSVINANGLIDERPMYDDEGNKSHTLRYEYTYYE